MLLRSITPENITIEAAQEILNNIEYAAKNAKSIHLIKRDKIKTGIFKLCNLERKEYLKAVVKALKIINAKFPSLTQADDLYSQFFLSEQDFAELLNQGTKSWKRYFLFNIDEHVCAHNTSEYLSAIWHSRANKHELQSKISRSLSQQLGVKELSPPSMNTLSALIAINSLGITTDSDPHKTQFIAKQYKENRQHIALFANHDIITKIEDVRSKHPKNNCRISQYYCETYKSDVNWDYVRSLEIQPLKRACVLHFKNLDPIFSEKLELFLASNSFDNVLEMRDIANALFIAWEYEHKLPDAPVPSQAARALGALIKKQAEHQGKRYETKNKQRKNTPVFHDMPLFKELIEQNKLEYAKNLLEDLSEDKLNNVIHFINLQRSI